MENTVLRIYFGEREAILEMYLETCLEALVDLETYLTYLETRGRGNNKVVTCCMRLQSHLMTFSRGKKSHLMLKKTLHAILARLLDVHQEPPSVRVARAAERVKFGKQDAWVLLRL